MSNKINANYLMVLINAIWAQFHTDQQITLEWTIKLVEVFKYSPLQTKRVMYVDDVEGLLQQFAPYLVAATSGNAVFHWHREGVDSIDFLVQKILVQNPEVLLLDYYLSKGEVKLTAEQVVRKLRENGFPGVIIGFSSEQEGHDSFLRMGEMATMKNAGYAERTILAAADLLA